MPDLNTLYTEYQGTSIPSFDGDSANNGQCEQWALMVRTKRDGLPIRYGNAIDWWTDRGDDVNTYDYIAYAPGVYPQSGDYVVWGSGVGSSAGHIDLCAVSGTASGFTGYDSNWEDIPKLTTIQHNYEFGILGYIRLKGEDMPDQQQISDLNARIDLQASQLEAMQNELTGQTNRANGLETELEAERTGNAEVVANLQAELAAAQASTPATPTVPSVTVTETGLWAAFKKIFGL